MLFPKIRQAFGSVLPKLKLRQLINPIGAPIKNIVFSMPIDQINNQQIITANYFYNIYQMGNNQSELPKIKLPKRQLTPKRNRNSYSLDLISFQESKIQPINVDSLLNRYSSQNKNSQSKDISAVSENKDKKLWMLSSANDELRNQIIAINKQLTSKLSKKNKKYNLPQQQLQAVPAYLKKQLEEGYKQIDALKKKIQFLKLTGNPQTMAARITRIQDLITAADHEIQDYQSKVAGLKNVQKAQQKGIKEGENQQESEEKFVNEIQQLKEKIKSIKKKERDREPQQKKMQDYMYQLQKKLREVNGQYYPEVKVQKKKQAVVKKVGNDQKDKPSAQEMGDAEALLSMLKLKQQDLKKKMNTLLKAKESIKDQKCSLSKQLRARDQFLQGLKAKKEVLSKSLKKLPQVQQLSQFQDDYIEQQEEVSRSSDVFGVNHLKIELPKPPIKVQRQKLSKEQKSIPKKWERKVTRIIEKGKIQKGQKTFNDALLIANKGNADTKIIGMNVWLSKQKKLLGIQAFYLIGNQIHDGQSCPRNDDQYLIRYQLKQGDSVKSVVGNFGQSGFLQFLMLRSNNGKVQKFGRQPINGQRLACGLTQNEVPICMSGACSLDGQSWRISRFSIQVNLLS